MDADLIPPDTELEEDARFRAAVRAGEISANRNVFIEEEEMDVRIKAMIES